MGKRTRSATSLSSLSHNSYVRYERLCPLVGVPSAAALQPKTVGVSSTASATVPRRRCCCLETFAGIATVGYWIPVSLISLFSLGKQILLLCC